jgi:enterochelin esterase family protein
MMVYTPPSYNQNKKTKYPVLYLLHGAGGDEYSWIARGPVGAVMDNLIAAGKAKEMIVVVTNGYPFQFASPNAGPVNTNAQATVNNMGNGMFEESLVKDVIPFIEKNYRVHTDKNNRAIAGFSMGGLQTQHITNANPNMFAYIAVMSMGLQDNNRLNTFNPEEYNRQIKALVKANPKLYWVGTGKEDFLYASIINLRKRYDEEGLKYEYRETEGGHTWSNWSLYLTELVPRFFK